MKYFILPLLLCLLSATGFSQSNWSLYKSIDGVNIFTKEADCFPSDNMNQSVTLIKIVNTNQYNITVEWDLELWYDGVENQSNGSEELHQKIEVKSNGIISGNCELSNKQLYIYKKFLDFENAKTTTKYILANLMISKN